MEVPIPIKVLQLWARVASKCSPLKVEGVRHISRACLAHLALIWSLLWVQKTQETRMRRGNLSHLINKGVTRMPLLPKRMKLGQLSCYQGAILTFKVISKRTNPEHLSRSLRTSLTPFLPTMGRRTKFLISKAPKPLT
jgi:hypothetical protein